MLTGEESEKRKLYEELKKEINLFLASLHEQNSQINSNSSRTSKDLNIIVEANRPNEEFIHVLIRKTLEKNKNCHFKVVFLKYSF